MSPAADIRFVLDRTSHPGNIGAAARAMKVMGLANLHLVAPKQFPHAEATARASSADDLLAAARVHPDLESAIGECALVMGLSARLRRIAQPQLDARAAARRALAEAGPVAFLFGSERSGLDNQAIGRCHYLVNIPTSREYESLNLAQAVQIMAYELHLESRRERHDVPSPADWQPAAVERLEVFFERLEQTLEAIRYSNPGQSKTLHRRLRRLFLRARPDDTELNILNGILTAARQAAGRHERKKGTQSGDDR